MQIDYNSRTERRECEKRWEVIQRLCAYLPAMDQIPVQKLTIGIVVDVDELKIVLNYFKKQKCYQQYTIKDGAVCFFKKNINNIQRQFKIFDRQHTHFGRIYELNKRSSNNPVKILGYEVIITYQDDKPNLVYVVIGKDKIFIGTMGSQYGRLVEKLRVYTMSIEAAYAAIVKRGAPNSRLEQYKHLQRISKDVQRCLSPRGYSLSLVAIDDHRKVRLEVSPKSGKS